MLFIGAYGLILSDGNEEPVIDINQIPIPELEDDQKQYESKLDALNDLKEVKQTNAPSIYDERYLDSLGVYDSDFLDTRKLELVDSIYKNSKIYYTNEVISKQTLIDETIEPISKNRSEVIEEDTKKLDTKALGLQHQLFFASNPGGISLTDKEKLIAVVVDGTQILKTNDRIRMRLLEACEINGIFFDKNSAVYGFVTFKSNRTLININKIHHFPVKLSAYDWVDGNEGIYIKNSFTEEATTEVIGDIVQDINIAGVPHVDGIKTIFQRNNRRVKVTVLSNYKLFLKVKY
ncbi:conjugative transposon protein TraM [uncultured Formosa sp.]|uniref:conjugative transposon protein TraM n=1 Tax=uncultured Formosa sp. TaxID=255435 RepID=UPI00262639A7|nr:conjugative transposon protein TraM [uncultured Formosa sp.]